MAFVPTFFDSAFFDTGEPDAPVARGVLPQAGLSVTADWGLGEMPLNVSTARWNAAERGGWADATLTGSFPDGLRFAYLTIYAPYGVAYKGRVVAGDSDTLTCEGLQSTLADDKAGLIYRAHGAAGWQMVKQRNTSITTGVNDDDKLTAEWSDGTTYVAASDAWWVYTLPEPVNDPRIVVVPTGTTATYRAVVYYATDWAEDTWTTIGTITDTTTLDERVDADNVTAFRILVQNVDAVTPSPDKVVTLLPTIYGTSLDTVTAGSIVAHVASLRSDVVPLTDTSDVTTAIADLRLESQSTHLDAIGEVLKFGDWRFHLEARMSDGEWKVCAVLKARPTTPKYTLTEGAGVSFTPSLMADASVSAVRAHYTDALGRARYHDHFDTNGSHPLVKAGIVRYADIDVATTDAGLAALAAARAGYDLYRPQVQGTVAVEGSHGGILAAAFEPGELVTIHTQAYGTVTARITSIACDGPYRATLNLDNAPTFTDWLTISGRPWMRRTTPRKPRAR